MPGKLYDLATIETKGLILQTKRAHITEKDDVRSCDFRKSIIEPANCSITCVFNSVMVIDASAGG